MCAVGHEQCGVGKRVEGVLYLALYAACGDEEGAEVTFGQRAGFFGREDVYFVEMLFELEAS